MKTISMLAVTLVVLGGLLLPQMAQAKGAQGVANTIHNMSSTSASLYASDNEGEICIFCHTPHGGANSTPLWNKALPDGTAYTLYSSATLTAAAGDTTRPIQSESLLCLSCHDGSLAINRVLNPNNVTGGQPTIIGGDLTIQGFPGGASPWIGSSPTNLFSNSDLSDDHPVSFSYAAAYTEEAATTQGLRDVTTAEGLGVRFFGGAAARLECSSCHDPHVDYPGVAGAGYDPFLITPNTGSALCLACHIK